MRVERGVLDLAVDEEPEILLDLMVLDFDTLVLLFEDVHNSLNYLICQVVNVRASLDCTDGIYEADLLELTVTN